VMGPEVAPLKALGATMDGFEVLPMQKPCRIADFIIPAPGCKDIVPAAHFPGLKDQVVLGNAGHFDNEVSKADLERLAKSKRRVREFVEEYVLADGKRIHLVAEGRLLNIAAGQGHPVETMDMSFAIQAVPAGSLPRHAAELKPPADPVPQDLDLTVARLQLNRLG